MVILILIYYLKEISKIPLNEAIVILATFSFAVIRMTPYISRFLTSFQRINYSYKFSTYAFQQIQNFMNINSNFNKEIIKSFENLIFEDLKFQYKTGREIIDIKKFEIKKGDVIGIFGRSGSGKSTLAEIILGYISPSSGTLKINLGKKLDLSHKKIEIDKSFYLPQNVFIFDENIFSNISMDIELKNMNEKKFKKIFDLTNLIEFSEQKKDMKLGENGKEISGGERQRIGFARCLYNNWDFIILDEATSAMDKYNEKSILEKVIKNKEKTQTILMISHNKNLLKEYCSEVYEFKEKNWLKLKMIKDKIGVFIDHDVTLRNFSDNNDIFKELDNNYDLIYFFPNYPKRINEKKIKNFKKGKKIIVDIKKKKLYFSRLLFHLAAIHHCKFRKGDDKKASLLYRKKVLNSRLNYYVFRILALTPIYHVFKYFFKKILIKYDKDLEKKY